MSAKTGGVEELTYIATRHDARERTVDWMVAVTIAGGIRAGAKSSRNGRPGWSRGYKLYELIKELSR